jgi:hypothetical protein
MKNNVNDKPLREKMHELSMGDSKIEADLAVLYYKNIRQLKEKYTASLLVKDQALIHFINPKY